MPVPRILRWRGVPKTTGDTPHAMGNALLLSPAVVLRHAIVGGRVSRDPISAQCRH